jgi:hypothetical protein
MSVHVVIYSECEISPTISVYKTLRGKVSVVAPQAITLASNAMRTY